MQITHKFIEDFTAEIRKCDKGARLGAANFFLQTESSMRPLVKLFSDALVKSTDLPWSEVETAINKIPPDKRQKYKGALDFLASRKDKWDFFLHRVSGFGKFAVPDFDRYISIPGRDAKLRVFGEGLAIGEMEEIIENLRILCPLIHELAVDPNRGPRRDWFAQQSLDEVAASLDNLDKYLNTRCTVLTFKRLHVGMRCDSDVNDPNDVVTKHLAGQVIPTVMLKGEDRPDYRKPGAYLKVPSGLKIFIGPLYFSVKSNYDAILKTPALYRYMTLAHELTHKILKTSDKVYELRNCIRIKDTPDAVACADSWGYFLTAARDTSLQNTMKSAMGYDD
jgi:hypothetical protein